VKDYSHIKDKERYFFYTNGRKEQNLSNSLSQALGMFEGVVADGELCDLEIVTIYEWLKSACGVNRIERLMELRKIIDSALVDGHIDNDEREEIGDAILDILDGDHEVSGDEQERQHFQAVLKGILANGKVVEAEVSAVSQLVKNNENINSDVVNRPLLDAINEAFLDGFMTQAELLQIKKQMDMRVGGGFADLGSIEPHTPKAIVVNHEIPDSIQNLRIAVTGQLESGFSRQELKILIERHGGILAAGVSKKINCLAVAGLADARYKYGTHGEKLQKVLSLNEMGASIKIIDADALYNFLVKL
jgi:NAD-dependent DNA ligase